MSKKIAILGAGNGAFAMAGDLALQDFEVAIWSSKKARLEAIWETKTIEVVGPTVQGQAKLALVTDHIGDAIRGADVICMPIPPHFPSLRRPQLWSPSLKMDRLSSLPPDHLAPFSWPGR